MWRSMVDLEIHNKNLTSEHFSEIFSCQFLISQIVTIFFNLSINTVLRFLNGIKCLSLTISQNLFFSEPRTRTYRETAILDN